MTNRERALNILHCKPADRLPAVHFGYRPALLTEWAAQGKIPAESAVASLATYGVNVSKLAPAAGMKYINGKDTVTYFGAVLFVL